MTPNYNLIVKVAAEQQIRILEKEIGCKFSMDGRQNFYRMFKSGTEFELRKEAAEGYLQKLACFGLGILFYWIFFT